MLPTLATPEDLPALYRLTTQCIARMRAQGIEQWDEHYPSEATLARDIQARTLHILRDPSGIVGCFTLDACQDPLWQPMDWTPVTGETAALHRLMIEPLQQGRGLSKLLMARAEALAHAQGFSAIHLDCFTANPAALRLYESLGYRRTGMAEMRKGPFVCFEKVLQTDI